MKNILVILLLFPLHVFAQSNENYIKSTEYKSQYQGNFSMTPVTLASSNIFSCNNGGGGGASGTTTITNNILSLSFSGSWSSTCRIKTGSIISLSATSPLPNVDLGSITQAGGSLTGYFAKIENQNLVFYSPFFLSGAAASLIVPYASNLSYNASLGNIFTCSGSTSGGASGSITITNSQVSLAFTGSWASNCNIRTGDILVMNLSPAIGNLELGPIMANDGSETVYRAKIENNILKFYSTQTVPVQPTSVNTQLSYNFGSGQDKSETIKYYDGLGRLMQTNVLKGGGNQQDIITPIVYDAIGRKSQEYLPYADAAQTVSSLNYRNNNSLINDIQLLYDQKFPGELLATSPNPYSKTFYENSPLGRPLENSAPGAAWRKNDDEGHTTRYDYDVNTDNEVVRLTVENIATAGGIVPILQNSGYYAVGELTKYTVKDENWTPDKGNLNTSQEFKDNLGRVVLKRKFNYFKGAEAPHDTYYVYDYNGNLAYVIPPAVNIGDFFEPAPGAPLNNYSKSFYQGVFSGTPSGGGGVTASILQNSGNSQLTVAFNGTFLSSQLNETPQQLFTTPCQIPDTFLGYLYNDNSYSASIINGALKLTKHSAVNVTGFSKTFTLALDNCEIEIPNQLMLDNLCYQYKYDNKDRLIQKKIPGKGWEDLVYDRLDRLVFSQDANARAKTGANGYQWHFYKYDAFGRITYTGEYCDTRDRAALQTDVNNSLAVFEEKDSEGFDQGGQTINYTHDNFPSDDSKMSVQIVNYYDNYDFSRNIVSTPPSTNYHQLTSSLDGLTTGSKVRIIGTDLWTTSLTGYDYKGRIAYTDSYNEYLLVRETAENKIDFTGKITESKKVHSKHDANNNVFAVTIFERLAYDHQDRLLKQTQKINNETEELITWNKYDELGQLQNKKIGNTQGTSYLNTSALQEVSYFYNIRGWLRGINDVNDMTSSLFAFKINYNTPDAADALYNGNISETAWRSANDFNTREYRYEYDNLNRLLSATYHGGASLASNPNAQENYDEFLEYDKNGNIKQLHRKGLTITGDIDVIDDLTYQYQENSNLLLKVTDGADEMGFDNGNSTDDDDYTYDLDGNMKTDKNKGITNIEYNYLSLPVKIVFNNADPSFSQNPRAILYVYDANGVKLEKKIIKRETINGVLQPISTALTHYANGFNYQNGMLQFIAGPEGYVSYDNGDFKYIYRYKDHLGNIRLSYTKNSQTNTLDIIEENGYYPFGLEHKGYGAGSLSSGNINGEEYKYNGKELQDELGLNMYDYGARNYDPALGRWMNTDPLAETSRRWSPYTYCYNNPLIFVDTDGMQANPIYDPDGNFLGTDDRGLQGKGIVMEKKDFKQGMSGKDADKASIGQEGFSSREAFTKATNHIRNLPNRPDFDGIVTIGEGIKWAKDHPNLDNDGNESNGMGNATPDDWLYLDASKMDFGNLSAKDFPAVLGQPTYQNLLYHTNHSNPASVNTTYALGQTEMMLLDNKGTVQIINGNHNIYNWDRGGNVTRQVLIGLDRIRAGIDDSHGFPIYIYGKGKLNKE